MVEAGRQSRDVGPFLAATRMDAGKPQQALPPVLPEVLINVDIDRGGRAIVRPGSHFVSRIGEGAVLGMYDHSFETGAQDRKLCAIVADHHLQVNTGAPADDGTGQGSVGFCPDVTRHGQYLSPINAKATDRFHFQSFLDRLYFAGSSVDQALYEHNYATGTTRVIPGVKAKSVAAVGNRLYVAGDPSDPNTVFPSDPDDPEAFQAQLGFRLGTGTDGILALREHEGMLVAFGERSCSWAVPGAIELGDLQAETFTREHGIVGPLAVATGGDGFLYWISREDGIVRWRRGMPSPDAEFSEEVRKVVQTVARGLAPGVYEGAVVAWDPARQAVRFEIPGVNLLLSYFPYAEQAWTIGASTDNPDEVALLREYDSYSLEVGEDRYTALSARRNPATEAPQLYGGDATGSVWLWREFEPDRLRWDENEGDVFRTLVRFGNVELAPIGYRAVVENALVLVEAGYEFDFTVWADRDWSGFELVEAPFYAVDGGELPLFLTTDTEADNSSRLLDRRLHPMHTRVGNWDVLIAKAFRFQVGWDCLQHMAMVGMELEVSPEAHDEENIRYPPATPDADVLTFLAPGNEGGGTFQEPTEPHEPGENPNVPPDAGFVFAGSAAFDSTDRVAIASFDQDDLGSSPVKEWSKIGGWNSGNWVSCGYVAVSSDQTSVWMLASRLQTSTERALVHFTVDPEFGTDPVKDYERNVLEDCEFGGGSQTGAKGGVGLWYIEDRDELWLLMYHAIGDWWSTLLCYDVSDPTSVPTRLFAANLGADYFDVPGFLVGDSRGNLYMGQGGDLRALSVTRDGSGNPTAVTTVSYIPNFSDQNGQFTAEVFGDDWLVVCDWGQANWVKVFDISDPGSVSLVDTFDFDTDGAGVEGGPTSPTFNDDGSRLYVFLRTSENASGTPRLGAGAVIFDFSDPGGAGLSILDRWEDLTLLSGEGFRQNCVFYSGPQADQERLFIAKERDLIVLDVAGDSLTLIGRTSVFEQRCYAMGMAGTPNQPKFSTSGGGATEPDAVDANLCALQDGKSVVLVGSDDTSAPTLDAFFEHPELLQRGKTGGIRFGQNGDYLYALSGRTGTLFAYRTGADFGKASELQDDDLLGCYGLMADVDAETLWALNLQGEIVEIDVSDPTAPSVTATTKANPLTIPAPVLAKLRKRRGDLVVMEESGNAFLLDVNSPERHDQLRPDTQRGLKYVSADATYLYGWNDRSTPGLAIVDHTDTVLPTTGYLEHAVLADISDLTAGTGFVAVICEVAGQDRIQVFDVSTPASPSLAGSIDLPGATALAAVGDHLLVTGDDTVSWDLKLYDLSTPASPSLDDTITGTDDCSHLVALGTGTACAYFDGADWQTVTVGASSLTAAGSTTPGTAPSALVGAVPVDTSTVAYYTGSSVALLDCSTLASPSVTGSYSASGVNALGGGPTGSTVVAINRSTAAISGGSTGVFFLDCTGADPTLRSDGLSTQEADALGEAPYVATGVGSTHLIVTRDIYGRGLSKVAVSDLTMVATLVPDPVQVIHLVPDGTSGIGVSHRPFRVWDLSAADPEHPRLRLSYASPESTGSYDAGAPSALSEDGGVLFVGRDEGNQLSGALTGTAFSNPGVYAYDVSAPESASRTGRYLTDGPVRALAVSGSGLIVYAVAGFQTLPPQKAKLYIIDFTTPASPSLLGSVELPLGFLPNTMELY